MKNLLKLFEKIVVGLTLGSILFFVFAIAIFNIVSGMINIEGVIFFFITLISLAFFYRYLFSYISSKTDVFGAFIGSIFCFISAAFIVLYYRYFLDTSITEDEMLARANRLANSEPGIQVLSFVTEFSFNQQLNLVATSPYFLLVLLCGILWINRSIRSVFKNRSQYCG